MNSASEFIDKLGGIRKAAAATGDAPSTVQGWKKAGRVPANRVVELEEKTGIPREEIRPDLYRRDPAPESAQ